MRTRFPYAPCLRDGFGAIGSSETQTWPTGWEPLAALAGPALVDRTVTRRPD